MKIKVGFDPTKMWDNYFFREFIKSLVADVENYDVYLITSNPDTDFVNNVTTESGININNVNQVSNNSAVVTRLNTLKVLIYLAQDNELVIYVNNTIPIQLIKNNVSGCEALVMNNILDPYKVQQKFVTQFYFWRDQIIKQY